MITHHTQFLFGSKKEDNTVVIGLDFGTSCTKVVVNNISAGKAFGIPFGKFGHPNNPYLIPTRPYFDKTGILQLSSKHDGLQLKEIKGVLMGIPSVKFNFDLSKELETGPVVLSIAYLALILRLARTWFIANHRKAFGHVNINWQLNIGIPTTGNEFEKNKNLFKDIAVSAWWLSVQESEITKQLAEHAFEFSLNPEIELTDIHRESINVIPEVVAEVIGYAQSNQRDRGLHLMIDVGAGTVDIASFNLGEDEIGNKYSIFTGDVRWLGAFELHKYRIGYIKEKVVQWLNQFGMNEDPLQAIPEFASDYLPDIEKLDISKKEIDSDFANKCIRALNETWICLRKKRDPYSPKWKSGIPVFLCGGGSQIPLYEKVIQSVSETLVGYNLGGLNILSLPLPTDFDVPGLKEEDFHRLAVAYGLSFPEYEIGTIYPPLEIPDMPTPDKIIYDDNFPDKDHV